MAIGYSDNIRSKWVQICTPKLLHRAMKSSKVKSVCAQLVDALESRQRGELGKEDYEEMKRKLKAQLPIITPHATFKLGRRKNDEAIPSGLSIYDIDHIPDPRGYWEEKKKVLDNKQLGENKVSDSKASSILDLIVLAHVTPSTQGLRLVFIIPEGMDIAMAQRWMSEQLEDKDYDSVVKDMARPSFLVPEEYLLYINEEELFKERKVTPQNGNHQVQSSKFNVQNNENVQSNDNVQNNPADDSHLSPAGDNQAAGGVAPLEVFPTEYQGIPYKNLVDKLIVLLGGEPEHGSRNTFIFTLACYLRYLCDDNAAWIKQIIPTFGEEQQRAFSTVDSACNRKQSHRMPSIVRNAIRLVQEADSKAKADGNFDDEDFGDIHNPESYFYNIHQMPQKLPKLIKLLISKTPAIYQPAVSQAVFPPLAAHLCQTRFLYIDNVEHEATLMQILCAPTGSGKESISQPINRIMADIRKRDAEQRERERLWKDECNSKGANKDKRERPAGLVIQEVNIDMTNPAFVLRMKEADNHFLYAKINELNLFDALKGKTNQQFRIMELAFDLGNYGQDRVGTQSVTETVKVRFNWNACCTPKKCRDYFRRVVTDGPISRISFATIERRPCGSEIPVYGTYDAAFDEELRPYIENLVKARGLVNCPQALRLARKLVEENAEFARLSQNYVFENLSFRANVIAYLKACVLYVANGMKWEKSIEDFIRWSERYDLWCKLKLFGQMIYEADNDRSDSPKTAPRGPKNMLLLLPDEFTFEDYIKLRRSQGFEDTSLRNAKCAINQWIYRNYVVKVSLSGEISEDDNNNNNSFVFRKLKYLTNKT